MKLGKRGISPVVGVILMVAITVILAAVIGVFVLDLGNMTGPTPQAGVTVDENPDRGTAVVTIMDPGNLDTLRVESGDYDIEIAAEAGATAELPATGPVAVVGVVDGNDGVIQSHTPAAETTQQSANYTSAPADTATIHADMDQTDSGAYIVTDVHELQAISEDLSADYVLGNDIEAGYTATWNGDAGFAPIGTFAGTFDGNGHTINSLTIDRPTVTNTGLFGSTSGATVTDVTLSHATVTGDNMVGPLIGDARSGTEVTNTTATGYVTGNDEVGGLIGRTKSNIRVAHAHADTHVVGTGQWRHGGLIGYARSTTLVEYSSATGRVDGAARVGGLVGQIYTQSHIKNSWVAGDISGDGSAVGGLVGRNHSGSGENTVTKSYVTGDILSGPGNTVGALVGENDNGFEVSDSYWDTESMSISTGVGDDDDTNYAISGLTTGEMTGSNAETNMAFDFTNTWATTSEYPRLR